MKPFLLSISKYECWVWWEREIERKQWQQSPNSGLHQIQQCNENDLICGHTEITSNGVKLTAGTMTMMLKDMRRCGRPNGNSIYFNEPLWCWKKHLPNESASHHSISVFWATESIMFVHARLIDVWLILTDSFIHCPIVCRLSLDDYFVFCLYFSIPCHYRIQVTDTFVWWQYVDTIYQYSEKFHALVCNQWLLCHVILTKLS